MLINVIHQNQRTELRHIEIGQQLVGVRIMSMVIENSQEMLELATDPRAQAWLKSCAHRVFPANQ